MKIVESKQINIFDELYIAYPMIDNIKQIDPIVFGVIKIPNTKYDSLEDFKIPPC